MNYSRIVLLALLTLLALGAMFLFFFVPAVQKQLEPVEGGPEAEVSARTFGLVTLANGQALRPELAMTDAARTQGLSGRRHLPEGEGMLFLFPEHDKYSFWMKDMRFAIDIIWIRDERIVGIEHDAPAPASWPPASFRAPEPVNRVLEVPAGYAREHGLEAGDTLEIDLPGH